MSGIAGYSRRWVLRLGAALLANSVAIRRSGLGRSSTLKQVADPISTDSASWQYREYAVHANVMLGSLPLFSKRDVGGAAMAFEQAIQDNSVLTGLQFIAGSWPDRLRGFNRFGATQEIVREQKQAIAQSAYVGFMASSREEGLSDARKAFVSPTGTQTFTVAVGRATAEGCTYVTKQRTFDSKLRWTDCVGFMGDLDADTKLPPETHVANYGPGCLPTFLYAVRRATTSPDQSSTYVHNGKVYRLRVQSKVDAKSGQRVITGWTSEIGTRGESEFRFWLAQNDPTSLPIRIEFRARSFLKLTLETEETAFKHALRPLLKNPS